MRDENVISIYIARKHHLEFSLAVVRGKLPPQLFAYCWGTGALDYSRTTELDGQYKVCSGKLVIVEETRA